MAGGPANAGVKSTSPELRQLFSFRLRDVLYASGVLRVSSDTSRVKVKRFEPNTRQTLEVTYNCSPQQPSNARAELWLRDGDRIEVPEK